MAEHEETAPWLPPARPAGGPPLIAPIVPADSRKPGGAEALARPLPAPPPRWLVRAVTRLRRGLRWAADRVVPARLALFEMIPGVMVTQLLHAAARLRIADLLADGPASAGELAARTATDADSLHRMLRGLATLGVFALSPDGRFRNNRLSAPLCSGGAGSLRQYADYFGSASNVLAWADFDWTLATGRSAFQRMHGMTVWDWFDAHPAEREVFAGAMVSLTELFAAGVATCYPFAEVHCVCDVGGGSGTLLAELLLRHPHLRGVLFDGPGVVELARSFFAGKGLAERAETVAGSFFAEVPAGCDAYLLKNVLHDWDDERAYQILANCRRAMQPGGRLLVVEAVVEPAGTSDIGPLSDLQMMTVCCEGRERGGGELEELLKRAGFRLTRLLPTPGPMSVIEGIAC